MKKYYEYSEPLLELEKMLKTSTFVVYYTISPLYIAHL